MSAYVTIVPGKNTEYPILTVLPKAQYIFDDSAPFFRMIDESAPAVNVDTVWNM